MIPESKPVNLQARPVELQPLEQFKVTIQLPTRQGAKNINFGMPYPPFVEYMLGFLNRRLPCDCPTQTLMRSGCQCDGC